MNAWLTKQQPAPDTSDKHPAFRAFVRYNHQNYAKDGPWPVAEETGHGPASAYLPHDIADQWASAAAGRGHAPADAAAAGDGHALAKAGGCREGSAPRANAIWLAWLVAWSSTAESVTRASAMLRRCRCPALGPICPPATTTASPPPSAVSRRTARWRRPMWSEAGVDDVASAGPGSAARQRRLPLPAESEAAALKGVAPGGPALPAGPALSWLEMLLADDCAVAELQVRDEVSCVGLAARRLHLRNRGQEEQGATGPLAAGSGKLRL